jgi:hypothetical protein
MKTTQLRNILAAALSCALTLPALAADDKKVKEQNEVRKVAHKTLEQLYKAQPKAKTAVANAAGYAAFNNMGVKILFAGSGKGKGLAVNNKTKKETFMKMLELQAGLGMGVKIVTSPEAVEKVRFSQNSQNFGDRKCLPEARTLPVGLPNAKFF